MDLSVFCRHFYASRYLPVALFEGTRRICSYGFSDDINPYIMIIPSLIQSEYNPAVYSESGLYGSVRIKATEKYLIIGPAYEHEITDRIVLEFMKKAAIENDKKTELLQILTAIPKYTYNCFLNLIAFIHYLLNGEDISVTEHFAVSNLSYREAISAKHSNEVYNARDEQLSHGTYLFERRMLSYVMDGNTEKMRLFLLNAVREQTLNEGRLADNALRQAKNIFIGATTLIGKEGAIPGGMDIEEAYQLIDIYIRECESLQSIDAIKNLQFNMIMDFTGRVAQAKKPAALSEEIFSCMQYISTHLNSYISLDDVATLIGKSRAYTTSRFRKETGLSIAEYIMRARIQEAKTLLKYTDKPISEISSYLCFSSQPYFSNVFKKYCGMTPASYRNSKK